MFSNFTIEKTKPNETANSHTSLPNTARLRLFAVEEKGIREYVMKPIVRKELARVIRQVLEER